MINLSRDRLEKLRDNLRARGQRPSMLMPSKPTSQELMDAVAIVEEYGPLCEAMYLMMAVDHHVVNAEREVLRGALDVLSDGRVRTTHMEAMIDASARSCAMEGAEKRLHKVLEILREDPARAELTVVLAAAVAAADARIVPEEHALLNEMFKGLGIDEKRANELLQELSETTPAKK
jgi:tellurite resistance protein